MEGSTGFVGFARESNAIARRLGCRYLPFPGAEPECDFCRREVPCECRHANGGECMCSCGRCLAPYSYGEEGEWPAWVRAAGRRVVAAVPELWRPGASADPGRPSRLRRWFGTDGGAREKLVRRRVWETWEAIAGLAFFGVLLFGLVWEVASDALRAVVAAWNWEDR